MGEIRSYKKKNSIRINATDGDIIIPDLQGEYLLQDNTLYIKRNNRESKIVENTVTDGEKVEIGELAVEIYKDYILIVGNGESYTCKLKPYNYKRIPFEGFPYYKKSPRILYRIQPEEIVIKRPPEKENMSKNSLMQVIIPPLAMMAVCIFMCIVMKRGIYVIASICMSLVTVTFSSRRYFTERKEIRDKNIRREIVYRNYLLRQRGKIQEKRHRERMALNYHVPNLNNLTKMVFEYSNRLYERNPDDEDFMEVSIGYQKGDSAIRVKYDDEDFQIKEDELKEEAIALAEEYKTISHLPYSVNLRKSHLGLVGSKELIHNQLKYLFLQLCFFQSYHDVQVVLVGKEEDKDKFAYLRWYPHLKIQSLNMTGLIFNNGARDQVLGSILQIIKDRKLKIDENNKEVQFLPQLLFVIDDAKLIQDHAIMEYLGKQALELGISIIYTSDQIAKLPENIQTVCVLDNSSEGHIVLNNGLRCEETFEIVSMKQIDVERISRKSAALIHEKGMVSRIPESITFFDMYHIKHPEELNAIDRWSKHDAHKSLAVPLGVREQDNYVELNLHEKAHGPHGLVAGTTGSGKSEIVQSYILSLAANFHPYEVGFLLIDYKGGGMANLFQNLPHLLGTITNLDGSESYRAMISIKSELARRQRIFNEYGVNHINGYHKLYKLGKVTEPIPHLFLISDEFAELKKEQPEFMKELVSTARIGRSLGIHLILATQKPSGVVDEQIWTNSRFKLCLKVQNESDSREMLKTGDAAMITQPGRAYLQVGNNEIYELFQSAFSGATYDTEEKKQNRGDNRVYLVNGLGQGQLINQDLGGSLESNQIKKTQLDVTVDYLNECFTETGLERVKSPWLPPLTEKMVSPAFDMVRDSAEYIKELDLNVAIGVEDIPQEQRQTEYILDFLHNGHVIYFASTGFGKSVFLENIVLSLCGKNSVHNLHVYIMDLGNSALMPLKGLPHVADYISYDDSEKHQKLVKLLQFEMKHRKQILADAMSQNFEVYNQGNIQKMEAIIVIVDNYDVVKEAGIDENFFVQLARDGANLGIYLAITASRSSVVKYALMNQIKTKIAGYNFEPMESRNIVGRGEYEIAEVKGRSLVKDNEINLMQIYTPVDYETGLDFNKKLINLVNIMKQNSSEDKVKGIAVLPEQFTWNMMSDYEQGEKADIFLGLEKQDVRLFGINCTDTPFLIVGPVRSGKSNTCRLLLNSMNSFEKIYVFDSSDYELQSYNSKDNVVYMDDEQPINEWVEDIEELIQERQDSYRENRGKSNKNDYYNGLDKYGIFINNIDQFQQQIGDKANIISTILQASDVGILVVMSVQTTRIPVRNETAKLVKAAENGLILGDYGINTAFPTIRNNELPTSVEDGILMKKGSGMMIRIPRV